MFTYNKVAAYYFRKKNIFFTLRDDIQRLRVVMDMFGILGLFFSKKNNFFTQEH